ncbi:SusC/RagA family TonB-linked outer membrane protein [Maribacter sp. 2210JD10-5]|uniref:SusC/RagA family TonB-linked outer membrane protein n=1 Tax=Maribacter sp. 2210JD10-5 TaxID=3386272 RepID=UPI0039BC90BE
MKKPSNSRTKVSWKIKMGLKMKLSFLFLLTTTLALQANPTYSQSTKVTFDLQNVSVSDVLDEIEAKTEFKFIFNTKAVDLDRKITLKVKKQKIQKILDKLFLDYGTDYEITDRKILLTKAIPEKIPNNKIESQNQVTQEFKISGTVTEESGTPLPGASIVEKGTTNGTQTDFDGNFSLEVTDENAILIISYIGFETKEVSVNGQTVINVALNESTSSLDEVVVVGYGTQSNRKVTTAVSRLSGDDIADQPVVSAEQALQGRVTGLNIVGGGQPGVNPTVRIRGIASALNSDPLFVIDGIPVGQNALNDIHPDNIQDISVLKDAASTAIYGSRGANGVILITTKKGRQGKGKLSLSTYYGFQSVPDNTRYDLLNTDQYINFAQNTFGVSAPRFDDYDFAAQQFRSGTASEPLIGVETDWQDELFPGGSIQDYYIDYSGGTENVTYNIGGGYFDQQGVQINTYFQRATLNANFEARLGERFKIGTSTVLSRSVRNKDHTDLSIQRALQMPPYLPVRDENFLGGFRATDFADGADPFQPILLNVLVDDEEVSTKIFATAYLQYEFLEGLFAKIQGGIESTSRQDGEFIPSYNAGEIAFNQNDTPRVRRSSNIYLSPILTTTLSYNKEFGNHSINMVGGYEIQKFLNENIQAQALFLPNELVRNPANSPIEFQRSQIVEQNTGIVSWFGRLNYDYKGKYLIGGSIRRDQSSVFAPENNTGVFPAVSAGWRISDEGFFKGLNNVVTDFKLRGSWGINGNTAVGAYTWDPTVFSNLLYLNGEGGLVNGLAINTLFNRGLQWEQAVKTNIGLDAELFNGKLYFSAEWFKNRNEDLIIRVPISASTGFDNPPLGNVGTVENRGFEFSLGYSDSSEDFSWSVDTNLSFVENEVISLGGGEDSNISGPTFQNTAVPSTRAEVGEPFGFYYGWQVDRIYQSQSEIDTDNAQAESLSGASGTTRQGPNLAPGDIRFKDLNNDGIIDGDDRSNIGHYLPDFNFGLNLKANYKNVDFSANFIGAFGFELLHSNRYYTEGMTRLFNFGTDVLDAWTPTNTDTNIPRANIDGATNNARLSDRWVEKGDFVRLRFLTLGYTFPEFSGSPFSKLRIYGQGQNLLTFTGYTGYDPEVQGRVGGNNNSIFTQGVDDSIIPNPRTFILGLEVSF